MFSKNNNKQTLCIALGVALAVSVVLNILFVCKLQTSEVWPPENSGMNNPGPGWDE